MKKQLLCLLVYLISISTLLATGFEHQAIENLKRAIAPIIPDEVFVDLHKLADDNKEQPIFFVHNKQNIPLFKSYPHLIHGIPYISLGELPTPITKCSALAHQISVAQLLIKRDDLTGKKISEHQTLFGGNKVRKLEFLLADALAQGAHQVITFGCVGSNHALATAVYAQELGLKATLMLQPQANSKIVQRNLLLDSQADATMIFAPTNRLRALSTIYQFLMQKLENGQFPYIIPTGGSCPLGILGYVNAAFELKEQIAAGELPEPNRIYVPVGSCGTYVGLLLGLKAAGIKSALIGVSVEPEDPVALFSKVKRLFEETNALLHTADEHFHLYALHEDDVHILHDFAGKGYALFTQEGVEAIRMLHETENILLDGVYSGKAFAGLLADVYDNAFSDDVILFWNTFCSDEFAEITSAMNYKTLPVYLHQFFETKPLQESNF